MKNKPEQKKKSQKKDEPKKKEPKVNFGFIIFIITLIGCVGLLLAIAKDPEKKVRKSSENNRTEAHNQDSKSDVKSNDQYDFNPTEDEVEPKKGLPTWLDLGSKSCVPCMMMMPIIEDLKKNYTHMFNTVYVDIYESQENMALAQHYRMRALPTQIFLDENNKEIGRNMGYMSKEDIFKKWRELGYNFNE